MSGYLLAAIAAIIISWLLGYGTGVVWLQLKKWKSLL